MRPWKYPLATSTSSALFLSFQFTLKWSLAVMRVPLSTEPCLIISMLNVSDSSQSQGFWVKGAKVWHQGPLTTCGKLSFMKFHITRKMKKCEECLRGQGTERCLSIVLVCLTHLLAALIILNFKNVESPIVEFSIWLNKHTGSQDISLLSKETHLNTTGLYGLMHPAWSGKGSWTLLVRCFSFGAFQSVMSPRLFGARIEGFRTHKASKLGKIWVIQ